LFRDGATFLGNSFVTCGPKMYDRNVQVISTPEAKGKNVTSLVYGRMHPESGVEENI